MTFFRGKIRINRNIWIKFASSLQTWITNDAAWCWRQVKTFTSEFCLRGIIVSKGVAYMPLQLNTLHTHTMAHNIQDKDLHFSLCNTFEQTHSIMCSLTSLCNQHKTVASTAVSILLLAFAFGTHSLSAWPSIKPKSEEKYTGLPCTVALRKPKCIL